MAAPLRRCLAHLNLTLRSPQASAFHFPSWTSGGGGPLSSFTLQTSPTATTNTRLAELLDTTHCLTKGIHTSSPMLIFRNTEFDEKPDLGVKMNSERWDKYNTIVYPPLGDDQPPRPAEVCHSRFNIKYSPKKMWYIAVMIRGMSIDEAMKQLSFYRRKGAQSVLEVLEEAQEIAVRDHNVEFKSNLWICDSFVGKGRVVKGLRKHMGPRYGIVHYRFVHYFVRLREGKPPKHYYPSPLTGHEKMEEHIREKRQRRIIWSL